MAVGTCVEGRKGGPIGQKNVKVVGVEGSFLFWEDEDCLFHSMLRRRRRRAGLSTEEQWLLWGAVTLTERENFLTYGVRGRTGMENR